MSGGGNDFIVFDNRKRVLKNNVTSLIKEICQRRISIGADGVLLLEKDSELDFTMRYFNADGGEVEMCGNGGRCIAFFATVKEIASTEMRFRSINDFHSARVVNNRVKLQMSKPKEIKLEFAINVRKKDITVNYINTGVPHVVLLLEYIEKMNILDLGKEIRYHPRFQPHGTNVDFVQVLNKEELRIRTYERGVENETLACGTGCTAGTLISHLTKGMNTPVTCHTQGGEDLFVHYRMKEGLPSEVFLEGDVKIIYEGTLTL
jgi:diaminopimelate epimerase